VNRHPFHTWRDDLHFFDSAARKCQSSHASYGPLDGREGIDAMLRARELPVAFHGASAEFIKLHVKYCSLQSLNL
jgi:hypothetical protein